MLTFIPKIVSFFCISFFFHPFHFGTNPQFNILICKKIKIQKIQNTKLPYTIILKAFYHLKTKAASFSLTFLRLILHEKQLKQLQLKFKMG